jgi:VWFA-related protein
MALGRQAVWFGVLGLGLAVGVPACAQGDKSAPAQQVPDAPKPQTLPSLTPLSQVGPALPNSPLPSAPVPVATTGDSSVGTTLSSAPAPVAQAQDDKEQGPAPEGHASSITVFSNFVQVPFTVKDSHGHLVPGLTYRDVRVFEDGTRQQMKLFTVDPFPLSVAVVIDQSVTFDTMTKINNSLAALQGAFTNYDEVSIFTYNNGVRMQTPFTAAQSARLGVVLERSKGKGNEPLMPLGGPMSHNIEVNNQELDPNTSPNHGTAVQGFETPPHENHTLLDAILAAAQECTQAGRGRRRIVYVISDGKEYGSTAKEKQVIKYLQSNNIEVYATLVGDTAVPGLGFLDRIHLPLTMRDDILPRIVAATGGQSDPEFRQGGIEKSFAKITEEVRTQYTVGYYTHLNPLNEAFRKTEVRVLRPGLTIISKEGYYPTASDSRPAPPTPTAVAY